MSTLEFTLALLALFLIPIAVLTAFTAVYDHGVRKWGWPE
jgi:hypothetical protein